MTPCFFTWNCCNGEAEDWNTVEAWIKTRSSYLKIPYTTHTLNSLPAVHHLVMLSIQILQDDILERQEKRKNKEEETWQSLTTPRHFALCSFNNLLWQLPLLAGVSSQILSTHVQCMHYTHLYPYRRQLLSIIATCETRGGALKIKELQSRLEANLGFYRQGSV